MRSDFDALEDQRHGSRGLSPGYLCASADSWLVPTTPPWQERFYAIRSVVSPKPSGADGRDLPVGQAILVVSACGLGGWLGDSSVAT